MKDSLTIKQKNAIRALEKAIASLGKQGIKICGMDDDIIYSTIDAIDNTPNSGTNYCHVADSYHHNERVGDIVGHIKTGNIYQDSGGW